MAILTLLASITLLLVLIAWLRLNAFIALTITALVAGLARGMPLKTLVDSIQKGIGSTLGGLVLVLGLGVMLGSILAETGAARRIAEQLVRVFGVRHTKWAMMLTGFTVGVAMFYNAGFIVLIPLVFSVAASTGLPLVYLGIATASALSVTHGFLPPHPGPTAIALLFKANMGKTLLLGLVVAVPAILLAGIVFPEWVRRIAANPPEGLVKISPLPSDQLPSFWLSFTVALTPVILMAGSAVSALTLPDNSSLREILQFAGEPSIAMLLAFLAGLALLGLRPDTQSWRDRIKTRMEQSASALNAATMILLITAAGGAFKQVLQDSGIGAELAASMQQLPVSPLVLGWLIATAIRISIGSATVAGLTAAGIVQPLLAANPAISPELMVLSIGAGSLMCSHVNDTGFWMFKEYFGLTLRDTFRSWTLMETIVGTTGLAGVLLLNLL
jgi:Gnt-I system high-affinity gluconate transporter/Gnt-II system L-idonate transporter